MALFLMFFVVMCMVTVIVDEAMDLPVKRRIVDAGRPRIDVPTSRASIRK